MARSRRAVRAVAPAVADRAASGRAAVEAAGRSSRPRSSGRPRPRSTYAAAASSAPASESERRLTTGAARAARCPGRVTCLSIGVDPVARVHQRRKRCPTRLPSKPKDKTDEVTPDGNGSLAKKLLIPAAAGVGTLAATYAATKAPGLLRDKVMPKMEERGGEEVAKVGQEAASKLSDQGGILGAVAGKATGMSGGGREKTRRLPIQRWTDVTVPVETAYEKWTEFEEFPKFMHRVVSVEQKDDNRVAWEEKIWFSKRQWEAEILEKSKNDRIVWKTVQGTSHTGLISFHELDSKLTRVMVTLDFHPSGMLEKMASGLRFVEARRPGRSRPLQGLRRAGRGRGGRVHARSHHRGPERRR